TALLEKYERFFPTIEEAGFTVHDALYNVIEGGNHITMAKTAGLTALEFANSLQKLNPDIVLIRGDRFEQLAIAMVAAYLNKTIAHIEGGDVTGTIDESVRHAITKLSHIHFVTNEDARERVIKMGENPKMVFNVGSPDVEFVALNKKKFDPDAANKKGAGHVIDFAKPFVVVMLHPVTTEQNNREHMETLLEVVDSLDMQAVWFWPNSDAGTNEMAKAIRVDRETGKLKNNKIRFVTDILPEDFLGLLRKSSCLIGNSSSGIKESSYIGVPVVNIGTRQQGRLRGPNVCDVGYGRREITDAIKSQLAHGVYKQSDLYYKLNTSKKIMDVLTKIPLHTQKQFYDAKS
ncbi:MAG: UDP-N-acetylglucosamine 2-epimerase, partial [Candidatus Sungbacteria bacterium]|nr:UDP-N-acetylglucosamine 2-epimerase [Candidatus Sungbacteria bacterium]